MPAQTNAKDKAGRTRTTKQVQTSTHKATGVKPKAEGKAAAAKASRSGGSSRTNNERSTASARASSGKGGRNKTFDSFFDETKYEAAAASASSTAVPPSASPADGAAKRPAPRRKQVQPDGSKQAQPSENKQLKQAGATGSAKPVNRKKKKRKISKRSNPVKIMFRIVLIGACVLLAWCLYAYYIIMANEQEPLLKADAGIILGAALWNEQPSPALKERLDYAVELYDEGLVDYLILSGGKPNYNRGLSEAEGMEHYLVAAGIPQEKLLLETQSRDTYENLTFSERVAKKHDLTSIMIITHNYHTQRAEDIAGYIGMKHVQTAGVKTKVLNESYHYTREMLAYTKWQLNKLLMPLGMMI